MKLFITVVLFSLCASVSAQDGEMFTQRKEHAMSNIDKRISYLQELKSCVSGSTNKDGVMKCRQDHKTKVKSLKDENSTWKEGRKAEKAAKKEAKKK